MIRYNKIFLFSVFFVKIILNNGFEISWRCKSNAECTAANSECINKICICEPAHTYNANMTKCLKVASFYEQECEDTVQCSAYLWNGGTCELESVKFGEENPKNICVCGEGYHYLHGRCYRSSGLGEKCTTNDDCYVNSDFEASSCKNGICNCSDGFYKREYRTCRRESKEIGQSCLIDQDCKSNDTKCSSDFKCISNKMRTSFPSHFNRIDIKNDIHYGTDSDNKCKRDEDCKNKNSICGPDLTCICKRAFFSLNGQCIPELGEPCRETDDKNIEDSVCRDGKWACNANKVVSKNNRFCRNVTLEFRQPCEHNEECYIFGPDAVCKKLKCNCNENSHFIQDELFCWRNRGIGEHCTSNNDCHIPGSEFQLSCESEKDKSNSVCRCPKGTRTNKENTDCIKIPTGINATCTESKDCNLKNGICMSNVCSCVKNFIPLSTNECIEVSSYGNKCDHHIQCNATLTNGICSRKSDTVEGEISTSGICSCDHTDHYNNGNCFKKKLLGDSCENESECFLEKDINRVKCIKGICSCGRKYKESEKKYCEKIYAKGGSAVFYLPIWIGLIATVCNLLIF